MPFTSISSSVLKVGDPITKDILDLIKGNLDDLDGRVSSLAATGIVTEIANGELDLLGYNSNQPNIAYFKVRTSFSINDFRVQLFDKQGISSGNLVIDLQKATNTDNANFATVLTTPISFDFATDAAYLEKNGSINSSLNSVTPGMVLRIRITGIPTGFFGTILIVARGQ